MWARGSGDSQKKGSGGSSHSSHGQPRAVVTSAVCITLCLCGYEKFLWYKNREQEMGQLTSKKDKSLWFLISEVTSWVFQVIPCNHKLKPTKISNLKHKISTSTPSLVVHLILGYKVFTGFTHLHNMASLYL